MVIESLGHERSSFITLTYDDAFLPRGGNLQPKEVTDWLKRLRSVLADQKPPVRVRYFLSGEYGEISLRPHYHLALFGAGPGTIFPAGVLLYAQTGIGPPQAIYTFEQLVDATWRRGFTSCFMLNERTAAYTAGYVVKKLATKTDPRLKLLSPEFIRMSNRPGIGMTGLAAAFRWIKTPEGQRHVFKYKDVPHDLQVGRKHIPLGPYLIAKFREAAGLDDGSINLLKEEYLVQKSKEMQALRLHHINTTGVFASLSEAYKASVATGLARAQRRFSERKKGTL